jgi:hypothetical protein
MRVPRRRSPAPPARPTAALELIAAGEDFANRPFGAGRGEMLPSPAPAPAPPPGLQIEPPPWADELAAGAPAQPPDPPPARMSALDEMRLADREEPPPPPIPMQPLAPLQRPTFPPPDWRAEEAERAELARLAARERRAALLEQLLAEDDETYPAKAKKP